MGEWWTTETSMENCDVSSISNVAMSPSRQNNLVSVSSLPLFKSSYSVVSDFCTDGNVPQCISYINQELASLGLSCTSAEATPQEEAGLSPVPALNAIYELLQMHRRSMGNLEEVEHEQLRKRSALEHMQMSNSRLKDQLELSLREKSGLHEMERQLQLQIKTLQSCLKTEKVEVQKLQSIIASRASQYSHDAKRKEREATKLKERLSQLLVDRRDKKLAIDVLNCLGRSDGKRSRWKTTKSMANHEGEMYKSLLSDYEARQRALTLENAELKKVLQQMKKEMIHILSAQQPSAGHQQGDSDGEETSGDTSRETLDQSCEQAREQLANSIRQQWRRLKSHVEKLDSRALQVQSQLETSKEVIPTETQEDEMDRMRQEVQQCQEFISAQQLLLQQQLNTSFDDETAALLNDCYTLEEKERLKEEWRLFEEQKRNFERERKNFTEAAIRLGREKKAFEEDRGSWLKNHFLNMTPFRDHRRCSSSDGHSALSIRSEPEVRVSSAKVPRATSSNCTTFSTPRASLSSAVPSTGELYRTLHLIPDTSLSSSRQAHQGQWQQSGTPEDGHTWVQSGSRVQSSDLSIFSLDEDENSL